MRLGPVRLAARGPDILLASHTEAAIITTRPIGFAGAAEADRVRWINSFRRLLDGLDGPVQFLIHAESGADADTPDKAQSSFDPSHTRSADVSFVEVVARSQSAQRTRVILVTAPAQAARLEAALREMAITFIASESENEPIFGSQQTNQFLHAGGWSRTWHVARLPGGELEAGWLHRLLPRGLNVSLSWHATPLPVAWVVEYLQRQLVGMRATRIHEQSAGTADPALAGALPNAEDLQRRLAASQEKAFHVSTYLTITSPTRERARGGRRESKLAPVQSCVACSNARSGCSTATWPRDPWASTGWNASVC